MSRLVSEPIPNVPDELFHPISALVRSAARLRAGLIALAEGWPPEKVFDELGPSLDLANRVVDTWISHLELDEQLDIGN